MIASEAGVASTSSAIPWPPPGRRQMNVSLWATGYDTYSYDALSRLVTITHADGDQVSYPYGGRYRAALVLFTEWR